MDITRLALASAAIKAITDLVTAKDKEVRAEATEAYRAIYADSGIKSLDVKLDGVKVATATLSIPKPPEPLVSNEAALVDWVRERDDSAVREVTVPAQVTVMVTPDYIEALKADAVWRDGEAYTPEGELIPGLTKPAQAEPKSYSIKFADGGREALLDAWRSNALAGLDELAIGEGEE